MAYSFHFDHDRHLVVVTFTDRTDSAEALHALAELPKQVEFLPQCGIVIDLRALPSGTTDAEGVRRFVHAHAGHVALRGCVTAIVTGRAVHFGLANMYATLCGFRGVTVGAFQSMEKAEEWLGGRTAGCRPVG